MKNINIESFGSDLQITYRWRTGKAWFLIFFAIVWNTVIFGFIMLSGGDFPYFILLHAAVGVLVGYLAIAMLFNTTRLTINRSSLQVQHGPLPWFGNRTVPTKDIDQLFVIESKREKGGKQLYDLRATLPQGKVVTIVQHLRDKDMGLELERRIEAHLGIQDAIVELPPNPIENFLRQQMPGVELPFPKPINQGKSGMPRQEEEVSYSNVVPRKLPAGLPSDLYLRRVGEELILNNQSYQVTGRQQSDWNNGLTDISFQLAGGAAEAFYAEERSGEWLYFEERELDLAELTRFGLIQPDQLPTYFENGDEKYHQRNEVNGIVHTRHGAKIARQWIYFTTSSEMRFRVLILGDELRGFIQGPIE